MTAEERLRLHKLGGSPGSSGVGSTDDEDAQHLLGRGSRKAPGLLHQIPGRTYRMAALVLFAGMVLAVVGDLTGLAPWRSLLFTTSGGGGDDLGHHDSLADLTREAPVVRTANGSFAGLHSAHLKQDYFLGVPYARPPVGALRFRRPQPLDAGFEGVRDAKEYSDRCVGYIPRDTPMGEDCLYLNIFRPLDSRGAVMEGLPVMVWLHGGGFTGGSPDVPGWKFHNLLQHSTLIHKPFIAISVGYRLSAWGFLGGDDVAASGDTNLGLRDQRLALEWIKENIAAFGGDPNKVTIDGQSAGAFSVGYHMTAFGGRDDKLFRAGILQSGNLGNWGRIPSTSSEQAHFEALVNKAGCSGSSDAIECLRGLTFDDLNTAIKGSNSDWRPTIDGDFIQKPTSIQLAAGDYVHVPILIGANTDEGTSFTRTGIDDEAALVDIFRSREPQMESYEPLLRAYPDDPCLGIPESMECTRPAAGSVQGSQYRRAAAFVGDFMFIANRRHVCRTWAKAGLKAYCYRFDARRPEVPATKGCGHSEEVPFVFDSVTDSENRLLARLVGNSWASFISDLDPNSFRHSGDWQGAEIAKPGRQLWPAYDVDDPKDYLFKVDDSGSEDDTFRSEGIDLIIENNEMDGR